jgi:hypothetical protein
MQRDDGIDKPFSPDYVSQIRTAGRQISQGFRVEAIQYLQTITAYDARRFENYLDAVHFFYRHSTGNSDEIDGDPDRIAAEIEMFARAYSPWDLSPLATIYHPSSQAAKVGDVVTVAATVDLATIHSDLVIAHFDSIAPSAASRGWVQRTIKFDGSVVYDADIADDSLDVHTVTIPAAQIDALRASGQRTVELAMELAVTQSFSRWNYAANIFVYQPDDVYLDWTWTDTRGTNIVVTSSNLESPPDRYLGLYGGSPSFMTVTPDYTQRVLDHARAAYRNGDVDGITVWEVMMNDSDSAIFREYQDYFAAVSLDRLLDLDATDSYFENWGGENEKWIKGAGSRWYYILPNGDVVKWAGNGMAGEVVASLDPTYYADPQRLFSAAQNPRQVNRRLPERGNVAAYFDERLGLQAADKVYENWGGLGEKWLLGRVREWYFITPEGMLHEWDRQPSATGRLIARLTPTYHANLELVYEAHAYAVDALYGLESSDPRWDDWGGLEEKWLSSKGQWHYLLPDGTLWRWHAGSSANLSGTHVATVDSMFHADPSRLAHAQTRYLSAQFGFHTSGNLWQNWGGRREKWFLDRDGRWYFLTPVGELYRWDGSPTATGMLLADLGTASYDELWRLISPI